MKAVFILRKNIYSTSQTPEPDFDYFKSLEIEQKL